MNILFVSQYFDPEPFSNTTIANALLKRGHQLDILTAIPNYPSGQFYPAYESGKPVKETFNGANVYRVRTISRGSTKLQLIANFITFALFGSIRAIFGSFRKPDVIFLSQLSPIFMAFPAIILAKRYKVPLVFWVQDIWPESATYTLGISHPILVKPLTWVSGWIYRRADTLLVQSAAFPPKIESFGVPKEKIGVFPNTASSAYRPTKPKHAVEERKLVPQSGFRIMFAGNIGESQDFDTIIDAADILREKHDIQWVIVGSGRDENRIKLRVADKDLVSQFHFLGRFPEERMPFFFAHADAMLVSLKPNSVFDLTVPYKVQSYMACGKPIIASLNGEGARIILEADSGLAVPAQSPQKLASAIAEMVESYEKKGPVYSKNSLKYFEEHYGREKLFDALSGHLKSSVKPT